MRGIRQCIEATVIVILWDPKKERRILSKDSACDTKMIMDLTGNPKHNTPEGNGTHAYQTRNKYENNNASKKSRGKENKIINRGQRDR